LAMAAEAEVALMAVLMMFPFRSGVVDGLQFGRSNLIPVADESLIQFQP